MRPHVHAHPGRVAELRQRTRQPTVRHRRLERILRLRLDEVDAHDFAEDPPVDQIEDHALLRHAEVVLGHFEVHAVAAARIDDHIAAAARDRHRLLDHDVFAALCDLPRDHVMCRVAGHDIHGHDVLVTVQHLVDIGVVRNTVFAAAFGCERLVEVTQRDKLDHAPIRQFAQGRQVPAPRGVAATHQRDLRNTHPLIPR